MENEVHIDIEIPFSSKRLADIAYHVLRVEQEPKRSCVTKQLTCKDHILCAKFKGAQVKQLRVAVTAFFNNISLISEVTAFAGPPTNNTYQYF